MSKLNTYDTLKTEILAGKGNVFKILEQVEQGNISNAESFHLQSMIAAEQRKTQIANCKLQTANCKL